MLRKRKKPDAVAYQAGKNAEAIAVIANVLELMRLEQKRDKDTIENLRQRVTELELRSTP